MFKYFLRKKHAQRDCKGICGELQRTSQVIVRVRLHGFGFYGSRTYGLGI